MIYFPLMKSKKHRDEGLKEAIAAVKRAAHLASALGITAQAINGWERVPHTRVLEVEKITGVPRHRLRPDLYPLDAPAEHAAA